MMQQAQEFFQRKFVQDTITLQLSKFGVVLLGLLAWVIVPVRLGPYEYGLFALAQSFIGVWQILNLTGIGTSTGVLLPTAIGARNNDEILNLLAVYVKVSLVWAGLTLIVMLLLGTTVAAHLYAGHAAPAGTPTFSFLGMTGLDANIGARIGLMATLLAIVGIFDPLFNLFITAFRSRRSMRLVALLQNTNQFVLTVCLVAAALLQPTAEFQALARVVYTLLTFSIAVLVYRRHREDARAVLPNIRAVLSRVWGVSYRPYWRFGLANALDKNLANGYVSLTVQFVGILAGPVAASYIQLGIRGLNKADFFTSAIFENMQAVIPQAVGRRDFARLWDRFLRVLTVLTLGGLGIYIMIALLAPFFLVPIFGEEWLPLLPLLPTFCIFGLATTVGSVFGPLYRAFDLMRAILIVKVVTLLVMIPAGLWLISNLGALGGVWMLDGLFVLSVVLTAIVTLPVLRQHARQETQPHV